MSAMGMMPSADESGQGGGRVVNFCPLYANILYGERGLYCKIQHFLYHHTTDLSARRAQAIFIRSNAMPTKPAYLHSAQHSVTFTRSNTDTGNTYHLRVSTVSSL